MVSLSQVFASAAAFGGLKPKPEEPATDNQGVLIQIKNARQMEEDTAVASLAQVQALLPTDPPLTEQQLNAVSQVALMDAGASTSEFGMSSFAVVIACLSDAQDIAAAFKEKDTTLTLPVAFRRCMCDDGIGYGDLWSRLGSGAVCHKVWGLLCTDSAKVDGGAGEGKKTWPLARPPGWTPCAQTTDSQKLLNRWGSALTLPTKDSKGEGDEKTKYSTAWATIIDTVLPDLYTHSTLNDPASKEKEAVRRRKFVNLVLQQSLTQPDGKWVHVVRTQFLTSCALKEGSGSLDDVSTCVCPLKEGDNHDTPLDDDGSKSAATIYTHPVRRLWLSMYHLPESHVYALCPQVPVGTFGELVRKVWNLDFKGSSDSLNYMRLIQADQSKHDWWKNAQTNAQGGIDETGTKKTIGEKLCQFMETDKEKCTEDIYYVMSQQPKSS